MLRTTITRISWLLALTALLLSPLVHSNANDPVVLVVTGKHGVETQQEPLEIKFSELEGLPSETITTTTPWTEGKVTWEGVRISALMEYLKTPSVRFQASALDGYEILFEGVDIEKYPVIIAYKKDGEYMSVRKLGPLWIMFPFDDHEELSPAKFRNLAVWQLTSIEIL